MQFEQVNRPTDSKEETYAVCVVTLLWIVSINVISRDWSCWS